MRPKTWHFKLQSMLDTLVTLTDSDWQVFHSDLRAVSFDTAFTPAPEPLVGQRAAFRIFLGELQRNLLCSGPGLL